MFCMVYRSYEDGEAFKYVASQRLFRIKRQGGYTTYPNITSKLPRLRRELSSGGDECTRTCAYLKAKANFAGFIASKGRVKKATKKQTAAPNKQAPNPSSLGVCVCVIEKGRIGWNEFIECAPLPT